MLQLDATDWTADELYRAIDHNDAARDNGDPLIVTLDERVPRFVQAKLLILVSQVIRLPGRRFTVPQYFDTETEQEAGFVVPYVDAVRDLSDAVAFDVAGRVIGNATARCWALGDHTALYDAKWTPDKRVRATANLFSWAAAEGRKLLPVNTESRVLQRELLDRDLEIVDVDDRDLARRLGRSCRGLRVVFNEG